MGVLPWPKAHSSLNIQWVCSFLNFVSKLALPRKLFNFFLLIYYKFNHLGENLIFHVLFYVQSETIVLSCTILLVGLNRKYNLVYLNCL